MLNKEIANLILDHKQKGRMDKYDFNFATFYTTSGKFGKIFDSSAIQKLYKIQDCLMDLPEDIRNTMSFSLNINGETSVKIYDLKNTIIFLTILRDNNPYESEANLDWLKKHC